MIRDMSDRGRALIRDAGIGEEAVTVQYSAMMRYVGQGYEVEVPIEEITVKNGDVTAVAECFAESYQRRFGRTEKMPPETVTWRVVVSGPRPPLIEAVRHSTGKAAKELVEAKRRPVWFGDLEGFVDTPVYARTPLGSGTSIEGPAVIEETESTLIIPPDFRGTMDTSLNLIVEKRG